MADVRDLVLTLLLLATVLVWGSAFVAIKILLADLDPVDVAAARFLVAAVGFLGLWIAWRSRWRRGEPMTAAGALRMFALGFLAVPAYHLALNVGEARLVASASADVAASVSALLVALTPLCTYLVAVPVLGERITWRRTAGLVVALAGVVLLVWRGRGVPTEPEAVVGALVVLGAPVSWGLYSVLLKKELAVRGPLPLTTYTLLAGTLLLLPVASPDLPGRLVVLPAHALFWVAWLGVAATFGGYVVWNTALRHWDATRVASFVYLVPLAAVGWAVLLVGERVTVELAAGGALILTGVWLASRRPAPSPPSSGRPARRPPGPPGGPRRGP